VKDGKVWKVWSATGITSGVDLVEVYDRRFTFLEM